MVKGRPRLDDKSLVSVTLSVSAAYEKRHAPQ